MKLRRTDQELTGYRVGLRLKVYLNIEEKFNRQCNGGETG